MIHKKLMAARILLQNTKLSKSGHNKFAGYYYFELGDFLPTIQDIFAKLDMCGVVSYTAEVAKLTITDIEDGTSIEITSPMGSAALKGCHEVQNIGAVETYQRRYLWVTAMEIVEHDVLDATTGSDKKEHKQEQTPQTSPTAQMQDDINALDDETRKRVFAYGDEIHQAFDINQESAYELYCEFRDALTDATEKSALRGLLTKTERSKFTALHNASKGK